MSKPLSERTVLITGAGGYLGGETLRYIAEHDVTIGRLVAMDLRTPAIEDQLDGVEYIAGDIRDEKLTEIMAPYRFDAAVHLVSVVSPGKKDDREFLHSVDVGGTENLIRACLETGVEQLILTSSGAAYGYYADNPEPLDENDALRGNPEFAYSDHKRLVEEMLADYRTSHPDLKQLILRPCTIVGEQTQNQIVALFHKKRVMGLSSSPSNFVFIWDRDVAAAIVHGLNTHAAGIYNLAGTGTLSMRQISEVLNKPYIEVPTLLVKAALFCGKALGLTHTGPEQVNFLRYRPVLANDRLINEFGFTPKKTSREAFDFYMQHNGHKG